MKSRAEELRRQHRKVLFWAIGVAAVLHVVAFLALPGFRNEVTWISGEDLVGVDPIDGSPVDVRFGPPLISAPDGSVAQEPPERTLQVVRLMSLPAGCDVLGDAGALLPGSVRLKVDPGGYAEALEVVQSTGFPCSDQVMMRLAGDLQYHWLPNERFPAPVHLVQPVTLVEAVEE